jgi:predicted O-linked N-acetylglucosamine transferase (SPINDLY family)
VTELAAAIRATSLDVLVFPDLGMDPRQQLLASWLLAPKQLALYGHPVTSGLATVDAFLSGELLEREDVGSALSGAPGRLPGLGAAPSPSATIPDKRWFEALRDARPTLLCLQNLSKLTPAFDRALVRILVESGGRVVMFGRVAGVSTRYRERLDPLLRDAGLVPEQALSIETARSHTEFLGAIEGADLVLDTPWFSGGVTSLDALGVGAPILAWEQGQARGRQTSAMLRLLELPELIAADAGGYIDSALRLLADAKERDRLRDGYARGVTACSRRMRRSPRSRTCSKPRLARCDRPRARRRRSRERRRYSSASRRRYSMSSASRGLSASRSRPRSSVSAGASCWNSESCGASAPGCASSRSTRFCCASSCSR